MSETQEDIIRTMYWHGHHADGTLRDEHCCGCWNVIHNERGLMLRCNECGEERDFTQLADPDGAGQPLKPL